ncbi:MAG TPA: ATP-binding protein [Coleofasciculaceae cyanobacterium]
MDSSYSNSLTSPFSPRRLTRSLSSAETWGFGLSGPTAWVYIAPTMHAALGAQAILVWIPATLLGMLINYQVKRIGSQMTDVAGGTPNYITHLLKDSPRIARYAAIGYILNWTSSITLNAIALTDIIKVDLEALGLTAPVEALQAGLTLLPFVLAFSGTRALSILHLFLVVPAIGMLITFGLQGVGWLALSPLSPGFLPPTWEALSFTDWAKWFFFATFVTYSCETASSFVADSRRPAETLKFLHLAAWSAPPIFVGGSWVVARLATDTDLKNNVFLDLVTASHAFWGQSASLLVTFLLAGSCLLASATAVSNSPRVLYQLALDQHLAPVFAVVSRRGVFAPTLVLVLVLSLLYLLWGNVSQIVVCGNVGWFVSFMLLHLGIWLRRGKPEILFPHLSLGIFLLDLVILGVGGAAWGWKDILGGLLFPAGVLILDAGIRRISFAPFQPEWWMQPSSPSPKTLTDSLLLQVVTLIGLLCGAVLVGWFFGIQISSAGSFAQPQSLIVVMLLIVVFVGVAIACWTSLPQVMALAEAREAAEQSEAQLREQAQDLETALQYVRQTQSKLVQSEKMSGLGQLVAGIAHEINNPVNFIYGNVKYADHYTRDLLRLLQLYQQDYPQPTDSIQAEADAIDLNFLVEDLPKLLSSMKVGAERIQSIVTSLRNFSRTDEADLKIVNVHDGIDSTLMILQSRLKSKGEYPAIEVIKDYGDLPPIECYAGQLNQVFMNLIVNAIDALEEAMADQGDELHGAILPCIRICTAAGVNDIAECAVNSITIRIADNGAGIPIEVQQQLYQPFFTTKPVGKGTGLGLSISYDIITDKHGGQLQCTSVPGKGTEFVVEIPIRQGGRRDV